MGVGELLAATREAAGARTWGAAVELARAGAVRGVDADGDEVHLEVKVRGRATPHQVYLWPDEGDTGCDCELPEPCVHVCAAVIALQQSTVEGGQEALPEPKKAFRVAIRYRFRTRDHQLDVSREIVWPDGRVQVLNGCLAESDLLASRADAQAESLLITHSGGALSAEKLRRLLTILGGEGHAILDDKPIRLSAEPLSFQVRVTDEPRGGFKVGLYRPPEVDQLYRGAALVADVLHPTSHGTLLPDQRRALVKGVIYGEHDVGRLVGEDLPRLRERIPVAVDSERLPPEGTLAPMLRLRLESEAGGLRVHPYVAYGDPPVARVLSGVLRRVGEVVIARDLGAERALGHELRRVLDLPLDVGLLLQPSDAATFLSERLPLFDGPVEGRFDPADFRVEARPVQPKLVVESRQGGWGLDVSFATSDGGTASVQGVLSAWRTGRSLVPLDGGGWAPLPSDWLSAHGPLLIELLEARDGTGRLDRHATAALLELTEDTDAEVPPDMARLEAFLDEEQGLPDAPPPEGLQAELRAYQLAGFRWLRFLRDMDLHGVLADDMGLGKTLQALAVMLDTPGPHLVVAPTSVLRNWQREAERFVPSMRVCVYHGPNRTLDHEADLVLTSYALLRLDTDVLVTIPWAWVVLDEAQAIKNPASRTAQSARALPAKHRVALTGTPVENRLDELWSLFRFLMPGLLGPRASFRDLFERPIEGGDDRAQVRLRRRVRPYVLRRLKKQVATELPALTEVVIRCPMSDRQRAVYETVRLAMRGDVLRLLDERGIQGATMQVLEALLRMRQACCDPSLLPAELASEADACKLEALDELLLDVICDDHKALVFSQWTSLLDRIEPRLEALGIPWVRLDGSTRDRQTVIDRFQSPDGPPVFLLSLKAGGTGLNLTAADYVIHMDPWWNPAVEQQATDRAHRIGQDKPVMSYKLIAEATVEERILELQDAKRGLAEAALGTEGGFVRSLGAAELRALFEAG